MGSEVLGVHRAAVRVARLRGLASAGVSFVKCTAGARCCLDGGASFPGNARPHLIEESQAMNEANPTPNPDAGSGLEEGMPTSDPYPRMILVCMGISMTLIVIIFAFLFFDFIHRNEQNVRPVRPSVEQPAQIPAETSPS